MKPHPSRKASPKPWLRPLRRALVSAAIGLQFGAFMAMAIGPWVVPPEVRFEHAPTLRLIPVSPSPTFV